VGAGAAMILNTMAWPRREVVVLPDKQAACDAGTDMQVDSAGNCLGTVKLLTLVDVIHVRKKF